MINELNILKTQEVIGEPKSDGISKKNRNIIGKGNSGSKKGIQWNQAVLVVLLLRKKQGPVGVRLQISLIYF